MTLSDKIVKRGYDPSPDYISTEDVKEFIKELKETFSPKPRSFLTEIGSKEICNRIDKLAGGKLI